MQLKNWELRKKILKQLPIMFIHNMTTQAPTQRITGYQVSTSYEVTISDFNKINDLLVSATSFGANTVGSVTFDLSEELKNEKLKEAREIAVTEAKLKASGLAKAAGINLGKIINISEIHH